MIERRFLLLLLVIMLAGTAMRVAWLRADPPVQGGVGIVWHDEGAWVHNARNRVLWGSWRTDAWNPVFVAPVFTAFEYGAFSMFGVGTWQARTVPVASGLVALLCLMIGLAAIAGRRAALIGGALLATNYAFVMWNRAALMESTMAAWLVAAWMAYALAERRPLWGLIAGAAAAGAWFTKASAAFFVAALALDAAITFILARIDRQRAAVPPAAAATHARLAVWTVAGLAGAFAIAAALFVLPYWTEYTFYNWQMSVTRKPEYTLRALADRASWLPIVQGIFARMWVELTVGLTGLITIALRWRTSRPAERLLGLWVLIGLAELIVHDSGNERRYVMFIPALIALASVVLGSKDPILPHAATRPSRALRVAALALVLPLGYLVAGSLIRSLWLAQVEAGQLSGVVRMSAGIAGLLVSVAVWRGSGALRWAAGRHIAPRLSAGVVALCVAWNVAQYARWVTTRDDHNFEASVELGRVLPPGTVVQGKLANGMSLENRIRPLFVGNGFGNYDDRLRRNDARYILTYDLPRIGYESSDGSGLIQGILQHYPQRRVVATFEVDETQLADRAALFDKFPDDVPAHARD